MLRNVKKLFTIAAIPAYNEEVSIAKIILRAAKCVDKVVVVDDGSTDSTYEIAEKLGAIAVRHEKNLGYGVAIRSCFEVAKKMDVDAMVILDGDGQHDPDEIPKVIEPVEKGEADIVIGSRFLSPQINEIALYRRFGIRVISLITNFVTKNKSSDAQSGFRAYSRKAINGITIFENGMGASSEILINADRLKLRTKEVQISCRYVDAESTQNPISQGATVIMSILRVAGERHPHIFFSILGFISLFFGMLCWMLFSDVFFRCLAATLILVGLSTFTAVILHEISSLTKRRTTRGS